MDGLTDGLNDKIPTDNIKTKGIAHITWRVFVFTSLRASVNIVKSVKENH